MLVGRGHAPRGRGQGCESARMVATRCPDQRHLEDRHALDTDADTSMVIAKKSVRKKKPSIETARTSFLSFAGPFDAGGAGTLTQSWWQATEQEPQGKLVSVEIHHL